MYWKKITAKMSIEYKKIFIKSNADKLILNPLISFQVEPCLAEYLAMLLASHPRHIYKPHIVCYALAGLILWVL